MSDDLSRPYSLDMGRANTSYAGGTADFQRDVDANTLTYDPKRVTKEGETLGGYTYGGPNSLMDDQNFASGMKDAQHAAQGTKQLADTYGRMGLLKTFYGAQQPTYTAGRQAFDSPSSGMWARMDTRRRPSRPGDSWTNSLRRNRPAWEPPMRRARRALRPPGSTALAMSSYQANEEAQRRNEANNRTWNPGAWNDNPGGDGMGGISRIGRKKP